MFVKERGEYKIVGSASNVNPIWNYGGFSNYVRLGRFAYDWIEANTQVDESGNPLPAKSNSEDCSWWRDPTGEKKDYRDKDFATLDKDSDNELSYEEFEAKFWDPMWPCLIKLPTDVFAQFDVDNSDSLSRTEAEAYFDWLEEGECRVGYISVHTYQGDWKLKFDLLLNGNEAYDEIMDELSGCDWHEAGREFITNNFDKGTLLKENKSLKSMDADEIIDEMLGDTCS